MKLRIRGNSVRLRLTQSEVETFGEKGVVSETVKFGDSAEENFGYELRRSPNDEHSAAFESGVIRIFAGKSAVEKWVNSDEVGIEGTAGKLSILIEKDFECLKPRPGEDESDNFPNPNLGDSC